MGSRQSRGFWAASVVVALILPLTGLAQEATPSNAARDWAFIQKLLSDGMHDVAARQLEGFAANYPAEARAADALLQAGSLWQDLDQPARALEAYDSLLKRHASSSVASTALFRKGLLLTDAGRLTEAVNVFKGVLSSYPASPEVDEARLALGEAQLSLAQYDEAGRAFRFLIGGRADVSVAARAMFDLGVLYEKTDADSLAIEHFDGVRQRYGDQPIAAFAQLRAAGLLEASDPAGARDRYEAVANQFDELVLKARARLGLARLLEGDEAFDQAAKHYREVADEGGTASQIHEALLSLARCELELGRGEAARAAAEALLARDPDSEAAKLLQGRAALQRDDDDAVALLQSLGRSASAATASAAWFALADAGRHHAPAAALVDYGRAAATAVEPAQQVAALLAQAELAESQDKNAWAIELAAAAATVADASDDRRRSLATTMRIADRAKTAGPAQTAARALLAEFPMTSEAAEARRVDDRWRRQLALDPVAGQARLVELSLNDQLPPVERTVRVARVLRTQMGDLPRALEVLEAFQPATVEDRARVAGETGHVHEAMAREAAARGDVETARSAYRRARARLADAAAESADRAILQPELLRLELALVVLPEAPWEFDATSTPLLGGVGPVESVNLNADSVQDVVARLVAVLDAGNAPPWVRWRVAELGRMDVDARAARLAQALAAAPPRLKLAIQLTQAVMAARQDDSGQASQALRAVLESEASGSLRTAAVYQMAELHRGAKRYDAAQPLYDQFAAAWPETRKGQRALLLAGDCALFLGETDEAAARYEELLRRDVTSPYVDDARYRLGTAHMRNGDHAAALASLESLSTQAGSDYQGRSLVKVAELKEAAGDRAGALAAWSQLLDADPELATAEGAALSAARLSLEADDASGALRWLNREDGPRTPRHMSLRVRALAQDDRLGDAQAVLAQLSEGHPDAADETATARLWVADALERAQRPDAAVDQLAAARNGTGNASLLAELAYRQGMVHVRQSEMPAAGAAFAAAVDADVNSEWGAQALFKLGNIASRENRDREARDAFDRLASLHAGHELAPQALRGLASSWRREGRHDEALKIYHRLLEQYPQTPQIETVLSQIAYCHHEMGQHEVSIAAYQRVMPYLDEEGQGYAQFWIADSYQKLGRLEEAAAGFLRIPYLYPDLGQLAVTAQLKAARVYEQMEHVDAAVRIYEKVLAAHGATSQWGAEAKKRLDSIAERAPKDSR